MFYPLIDTSLCQQKTLATDFLLFVVHRLCEYRNQQARLAKIV